MKTRRKKTIVQESSQKRTGKNYWDIGYAGRKKRGWTVYLPDKMEIAKERHDGGRAKGTFPQSINGLKLLQER